MINRKNLSLVLLGIFLCNSIISGSSKVKSRKRSKNVIIKKTVDIEKRKESIEFAENLYDLAKSNLQRYKRRAYRDKDRKKLVLVKNNIIYLDKAKDYIRITLLPKMKVVFEETDSLKIKFYIDSLEAIVKEAKIAVKELIKDYEKRKKLKIEVIELIEEDEALLDEEEIEIEEVTIETIVWDSWKQFFVETAKTLYFFKEKLEKIKEEPITKKQFIKMKKKIKELLKRTKEGERVYTSKKNIKALKKLKGKEELAEILKVRSNMMNELEKLFKRINKLEKIRRKENTK